MKKKDKNDKKNKKLRHHEQLLTAPLINSLRK